MNESNLKYLYDGAKKVSNSFTMDYETFKHTMADKKNREYFYDGLRKASPKFTMTNDEVENLLGFVVEEPKEEKEQEQEKTGFLQRTLDLIQQAQPYVHKGEEDKKTAEIARQEQAYKTVGMTDEDKKKQERVASLEAQAASPVSVNDDGTFEVNIPMPTFNQYGMPTNVTRPVNPVAEKQLAAAKANLPSYLKRGENSPEDIMLNAAERALNTEEGKNAWNTLFDAAAKDFHATPEFTELLQKYSLGEVTEQDINDAFNNKYGNQIFSDFVKEISKEGGVMYDYITVADKKFNQRYTDQTSKDLESRIDSAIEKSKETRKNSNREKYKSIYGIYPEDDPFGKERTKQLRYEGVLEYETELSSEQELLSARKFNKETRTLIEAVQQGKTFWGGVGDAASNLDTWDLGIGELVRSAELMSVIKKIESNQELTSAEELLMESALNYFTASAYYSNELGRGYKAGQTSMASAPFMLQFVLSSGTLAAMEASVKGAVETGRRALVSGMIKYAKKKGNAALAKYGAKKVAGDAGKMVSGVISGAASSVIGAGYMTGMYGLPRVAGGTIERMTGELDKDWDREKGGYEFTERKNKQNFGEALWNSFADNYIENLSEMVLAKTLDPVKAYLGGTNMFKNIARNDYIGAIVDLRNNPALRNLRQTTQFGGYFEEVAEEYLGGILRRMLNTDVNTWQEAGLDLDGQIDIFLGLAPTSLLFGTYGVASHYGGIAIKAKELRDYLSTDEQKEMFDRLMSESRSGEFGDVAHNFIRNVLTSTDPRMTVERKKEILMSVANKYHNLLSEELQNVTTQVTEQEAKPIVDELTKDVMHEGNNAIYATIDSQGNPLFIVGGNVRFTNDNVVDLSSSDNRLQVRYVKADHTLGDVQEVRAANLTNTVTNENVENFSKFQMAKFIAQSKSLDNFEFDGHVYSIEGEDLGTIEEFNTLQGNTEQTGEPKIDTKPRTVVNEEYTVTVDGEKKTVKITSMVNSPMIQNEDGSIKEGKFSVTVNGEVVRGNERKQKYIDAISEQLKEKHAKALEAYRAKQAENAVTEAPSSVLTDEDRAAAAAEQERKAKEEEKQTILTAAAKKDATKFTPEEDVVVMSQELGNEVAAQMLTSRVVGISKQINDINEKDIDDVERWKSTRKLKQQLAAYEQAITKWLGQETLDAINAARAQALQNTPPVQGEEPAVPAPVVEPAQGETPADAPAGPDTTPLPLPVATADEEGTEGEGEGDGETPAPDTLGEDGGVEGNEEGEEPAPAADKPTANLDEVTVWVAKNYDYIVTDKEGNTIFSSKPTRKKVTDAFEELHQVEGKVDGKRGTYNGEDCIIVRDNPAKGYVNIVTPYGIERVGREEVMIDGKPLKGKASVVEWRENNEKKYDTFESIMNFPVFDIRGEMNITFLDFLNTQQDSPYVAFYEMLRKHYREKYNDDVAQQYLDASVARLIENLKEVARLWNIVRTKRLISSGQMPTTLERKKMDSQSKRMKEAVAAVHNAVGLDNSIDFIGLAELAEKAAKKAEKKGEGEGYFAETDEERAESYVDGLVSNILWVGFETENKREHEDAVEGIVEALNKESKKATKQRELVVNILNDRLEEAKRLNRLNDIQAIERVIDRLSTLKKMKPILTEAGLIEEKGKKNTPDKPAPKKDTSKLVEQLSLEENSLRDMEEEYKTTNDAEEKSELEGYIAQAKEKIAKLKAEIDGAEFMVGDVVTEHAESTKRIIKILKAAGIRVITFKNEDLPKYVSKKKLEELSDGQIVYGFASNDTIYLNEDHFNPNSPLHEFTHLWVTAYKQAFPNEWKRFVDIANKSALAANLRKPLQDGNVSPYAKLSADEMASEVLSRYTGYLYGELDAEGRTAFENMMQAQTMEEKLAEKSLLNRIRNIWKKIISWFDKSIENEKKEDVIDDMIRQFAQLPMETLARGKEAVDELKQIAKQGYKVQSVYHGTAAEFDQFDHDFMGSGEGAQAYGWGTYVSQVEDIAISYAKADANRRRVPKRDMLKGVRDNFGLDVERLVDSYIRENDALSLINAKPYLSIKEYISSLQDIIAESEGVMYLNLKYGTEMTQKEIYNTIDSLKEHARLGKIVYEGNREIYPLVSKEVSRMKQVYDLIQVGEQIAISGNEQKVDDYINSSIYSVQRNLYTVEIPAESYLEDGSIDLENSPYLGWDDTYMSGNKFFNAIMNAIKEYSDKRMRRYKELKDRMVFHRSRPSEVENSPEDLSEYWDIQLNSSWIGDAMRRTECTGGYFYDCIENMFGSPKAASEWLLSQGIVGIRVSTNATSGNYRDTKNYVIFNEADAHIVDHIKFMIGKSAENLDNSKKSSTFAVPKKSLTKEEKAVAYEDLFARQQRGQFSNGYGYSYSANFFHISIDGKIVKSIQIEGNENEIKLIKERYETNESTGTFIGRSSDVRDSSGTNNTNDDSSEGRRRWNDGVDGLHEERESNSPRYNQEVSRDSNERAEREQIIAEAKANGTYMLAPNGQPTNLTEDQWVTVRTQAFKDYFGDWINDKDNASVVLDENGEPLVVYHGSRMAGFDKFGRGEARDSQGIYTTPNRRAAESYATSVDEWRSGQTMPEAELGVPDHHGVYSLFVNMRNPKVIDFGGKAFDRFGTPKYEVATNEALDNGERGILFDTLEEAEAYIAEHPEEDLDYVEKYTTSDDLLLQAKEEGYDGVIFTNIIDSRYPDPITNYVPFEPNQVKSATQNVGTFNQEDDRIEFMIGPAAPAGAPRDPSDPMHIDSEAARRLQAKSQKYFAELANPKAQLPDELNRLNEIIAKALDRTEGIRQIMESIKKFRKENGLPPMGEGFDVRTMVDTMDSKISNETKLYVITTENELQKAIYKLAKKVAKSDFYKKYKYEKEPKQNGKKSKLTPREIIERYLIACDSIEREELKGNPRGAGDFLKRMGVDMVQYRQEFLDAFADTQEGIEEINHLWETIRGVTDMVIIEGERSGLISQEEAISYRRRRFYVPERDFAEVEANEELQVKDAGYGSGRMGNKLMATQEAEGGETLAANVLANMKLLARDAIVKANKNIVKLAMFDLLRANEEWCKAKHVPIPRQVWYKRNADGSVTRVTDGPTAPEKKTMRDLKTQIRDRENEIIQERMLADSATDAATRQAHMDVIAEIEEEIESLRQANPFLDEFDARDMMFLSRHTQKESTVTVFVDGVPCEMHFPNMTIVANALNGTTNHKFAAEGLKIFTNALSATKTVYNPLFFTVNIVRDVPFVVKKGYAEYGWQFPFRFAGQFTKTFFTWDVWKAVAGNYKDVKSPYVREFFEGGGNTGYSVLPEINELKKNIDKWSSQKLQIGLSQIGDVISYFNTFSEVWTRLAAYSVVRDMGGSKEEGIRAAKNLSVNFNRKGLGMPFWDALMNMSFFANAALQGASGFYRTFKGNKDTVAKNVAVGFRAALSFIIMPAFAGFISTLLTPDDDDDILWTNDWDRDNYLYIGESGLRFSLNEQIKPAWTIGVNIALGMKGRRTDEQIASSVLSSVFTNWMIAPQNVNSALTMTVNSHYGTKDYSTAQVIENLLVPQPLQSITDISNNVDFMGYKIKNESGDLPAYMSNENSALLYKIIVEFAYEVRGGDKDLPSKHIEVVNEDGTIEYRKMSDLFDKSPKEIKTILSIGVGNSWLDMANAVAVASTDGEFVPTDYQTIKRFYKPRDKEETILMIMREARGITKDYTEQMSNYESQLLGSQLDGNTEKKRKALERIENLIGKGEAYGDKEVLKELVNAYSANTMYSIAKQHGMNETRFRISLEKYNPELLNAFDMYNGTTRDELVRKILTLTRDIKDMEVKDNEFIDKIEGILDVE